MPENRQKVIDLLNPRDVTEEYNLRLFLKQANIILSVTNTIGKVKVGKFREFVKNSYIHWITAFGKWRCLKKSIHWTLAHVAELIEKNDSYSLAEISENSLEALIKRYRYVSANLARQSTFGNNCEDTLNKLYQQSLFKIRRHEKSKDDKPLKSDVESVQIRSFFLNAETVSERKWTVPELTFDYVLNRDT